jgi:hypothetical protein
MSPEVTLHKEFDSGAVYELKNNAVFVPLGLADRVGSEVEDDEEAVYAAVSLHNDTPDGVVRFESNGRSATDRASLWAAIHDLVGIEDPLQWNEVATSDCSRVRIPALVAADGKAAMATFLAVYGFDNNEIGDALGVGSRTVSQYISDFQKGER